jgi:DNA-binding winged helix-turn-helix (wHTH) protein/tetratricopeptide (TPR) repeat protein
VGIVVADILGDSIGFGSFRLVPSDYLLTRMMADGTAAEVPLRPKAFDLLRYMVENPGRLIPSEEFFERLWPNVHVQADNLKGHMLHVRTALGDDPNAPTFIETIRGRGYRFIAPVASPDAPDDPGRDRHRPTGALLVGRSAHRRELDTMLRRAQGGEAGIGFVTGEPGIGKTSLAADFVQAAGETGALTITCRCLPGGGESDAYYPILDALTQIARGEEIDDFVGLLSAVAPTWLVQLPWLMPATIAGGTRQEVFGTTQHRMIRELCDLLGMLSRDRPFVLLIEDIHWADQASLDLINAVAARRLQSRLLLLLTMRGSGDHASARIARTMCQTLSLYRLGRELPLKPLTVDNVANYLSALSNFPPPRFLAKLLHDRSEGNPLFMTAMLDHFMQEGLLLLGENGWITAEGMESASSAPPSLTRIVESEIEKLDVHEQVVLEAGSFSMGEFSAAENHVATALDEFRFEAACEHLARTTALVRRAGIATLPSGRKIQRYAFRHMIFREIAYDRQSATRRAAAHLAIGEGLEEIFANDLPAGASALARNFLAAEQWSKAIGYLRLVARNAQTRFSAREAATILEQALELSANQPPAERLESEVELIEDLARVYAGSLDARAGETYQRLAETAARAGRLDVECRALLGYGFTLAWIDIERSMAVLSEAIEKSAGLADPVARARVRSFGHGWRSWAAGWSEIDAKACESAVEVIRAQGDIVALNASYVDYSMIVFTSSRYQEAHDLIGSCFDVLVANALDQRSDIGLPLWILRLGRPWTLLCAGSFGEALRLFDSGVASFLDNGDVGRAATLQFYQGFCHLHLNDHAGALDLCDRALEFCDARGTVVLTPNERQIEMVVRGLAELVAGRVDAGIALLVAAGDVTRQRRTLTSWHWEMAREWGLTDAYLATGRLDEARLHARQLHDFAYAIRERTWRAAASETAARIALRTGDLETAGERLREAWKETEAGELPVITWRLHAVEARLRDRRGDREGAEASRLAWRQALEALAETLPAGHVGRNTLARSEPMFG